MQDISGTALIFILAIAILSFILFISVMFAIINISSTLKTISADIQRIANTTHSPTQNNLSQTKELEQIKNAINILESRLQQTSPQQISPPPNQQPIV